MLRLHCTSFVRNCLKDWGVHCIFDLFGYLTNTEKYVIIKAGINAIMSILEQSFDRKGKYEIQ